MTYLYSENQWGERYIESLNRMAFLQQSSIEYYRHHLNIDLDQQDTMYVIVGSDSGMLIRYLMQNLRASGCRVVLIEPEDIYQAVIQECKDLFDADGNIIGVSNSVPIRFHSQDDWQSKFFDGTDIPWFFGGKIKLLESQACQTDYTQRYLPLFKDIRASIARRHFDVSNLFNTKTFTEKQLFNAADNVLPLLSQPDFGKGYTAIILGGGPSLDKHFDWIIENRDKLFIIAVSRLCAKLQSVSLKPDLVVSIDPYIYSYDVSKHGVLWKDVPLVNGYHVAPQLMQQWQGPRFYLGYRLPWKTRNPSLSPDNVGSGGPTVSHTAAVVASQMGFTTILMTGVDLCYDSVNTHSVDSPEAAFQTLPSLYDAQVETYSGKMAGTQYRLLRSVATLDMIGKAVNEFSEVLFNLSENAVRIDSIPHIDPNDVILPEQKPDFSRNIARFNSVDRLKDLELLSAEVSNARGKLHTIKRTCQEAQRVIDKMYAPGEVARKAMHSAKLDKLEKRLEKRTPVLLKTIKHYAGNELTTLRKPSGFDEMDTRALEQWIRNYYLILEAGTQDYLRMISVLEKRIQLRRDEINRSLSIDELLEQWDEDITPGRILHMVDSEISAWDESDQQSAAKARELFIQSVHDTDTRMAKKLKSHNVNIDNCMRSLSFLFNIKNTTDLHSLCNNLKGSSWPGNVLLSFAEGLIDEIEMNFAQAVAHYQTVIDTCSDRLSNTDEGLTSMQRIIEESLVRMTQAYVSLGEYESACTTLGTLCEMLPQYVMPYAKMLHLCNNTDSAIELLHMYIENYPMNWQAAQLLADILTQSGRTGEAEIAQSLTLQIREAAKNPQKLAA